NLSQPQRNRAMDGFRQGDFQVLVATNIAARGLDVDHITHVISFDVPNVPDDYVHRIGRTARANAEGDAFILEMRKATLSFWSLPPSRSRWSRSSGILASDSHASRCRTSITLPRRRNRPAGPGDDRVGRPTRDR